MSDALWSNKLSCNGGFFWLVHKPERIKGGLIIQHEVFRLGTGKIVQYCFGLPSTFVDSLSPRK